MKFEILIKYKLLIIILIFPILCYITRKVSPFLNSNTFKDFNDISFFGRSKYISKNSIMKNELNFQDYNNIRIFGETKYNKIKFYFKLSKDIYYDSNRIEFQIMLKDNISTTKYNYTSVYYYQNLENDLKNIQFKEYKQESLLNKKAEYSINSIIFKYNKKSKDLECKLYFKDFDFIFYLQKEILSFKYFYLLKNLIDIIFYSIIGLKILSFENNLQNISIIFLLVVRNRIITSLFMNYIDLFKVGIPIIKILIFYFHLLIYGEILLSITDIATILITFIFIRMSITYIIIMKNNNGNYFYCFNNFIDKEKIVRKNIEINELKYNIYTILFFMISLFGYFNSIFIQFMHLIAVIIETIIKHLLQREVMPPEDKQFCISFYFYGIMIYSYHLLIYNIGKFYRIKASFLIFPFIIVFLLYQVLKYVIINEYKIKYIMEEDFKKLKYLDKECCSICLKEFENKNNNFKLFCKVNELDNIHKTKCNHYYHEKCLFKWRKHRNICPICKKSLIYQKYYYFFEFTPCIYKWNWK